MEYPRLESSFGHVPARVATDMPDGLESGSCALAEAFFQTCGADAMRITERHALGQFFSNSQESLLQNPKLYAACTKNGHQDPRRHWSQVLFALKNHGKVLQVVGGGSFIQWFSPPPSQSPGAEELSGQAVDLSPELLQIAELVEQVPELLEEVLSRIVDPVQSPATQWFICADCDENTQDFSNTQFKKAFKAYQINQQFMDSSKAEEGVGGICRNCVAKKEATRMMLLRQSA